MAEAKRTGARRAKGGDGEGKAGTAAGRPSRDAVVDALMALAVDTPWREIGVADIAARAGMSLAEFSDLFPSKGAVLGAFMKRIDRQVLDGTPADLADEPARDRLFDVMMRRIDALAPYKEAVKRIAAAMRSEPGSLPMFARSALNSQRFMLAAAGISTEGPLGVLKLQGAAVAFGKVMWVWFDDESPDLAATMACLDRELRRGENFLRGMDEVARVTEPVRAAARDACRCLFGRGKSGQDGSAAHPGAA